MKRIISPILLLLLSLSVLGQADPLSKLGSVEYIEESFTVENNNDSCACGDVVNQFRSRELELVFREGKFSNGDDCCCIESLGAPSSSLIQSGSCKAPVSYCRTDGGVNFNGVNYYYKIGGNYGTVEK